MAIDKEQEMDEAEAANIQGEDFNFNLLEDKDNTADKADDNVNLDLDAARRSAGSLQVQKYLHASRGCLLPLRL